MAVDNKKPPSPPDFKPSFTVDETTRTNLNTMPSVTRLLNRKKLSTPTPSPIEETPALSLESNSEADSNITFSPPEIELEVPIPSAPLISEVSSEPINELPLNLSDKPEGLSINPPLTEELSLDLSPSDLLPESSEIEPQLNTRPAKLRVSAGTQLHYWDFRTLKSNRDPLAKGVLQLLEKGAVSTLFMALVTPPSGASVPHFLATAIAGESSKDKIWNGLKWDPSIVPSVWNFFIRPGYVELSPPGNKTDPMSQRNVLRGAFGVRMEEYLLLVRIGSETSCRGALAIISKNSFLEELQNLMQFFEGASSPTSQAA